MSKACAAELDEFYLYLRDIHRLSGVRELLEWDQQVAMPAQGAVSRAHQLELVSKLLHEKKTNPAFTALVDELFTELEQLSDDDAVNVRETKRSVDRARKLPLEFVADRAHSASLSYHEWIHARPRNDFKAVLPHLKKLVALNRQEADLVGYQEHPYDALLDKYEPRATLAQVKPLLISFGEEIKNILPRIVGQIPATPPNKRSYDARAQYELCARVASACGYDFGAGRLDPTAHPFISAIGLGDVRMTTRYGENDYLSSLFSTLHELGHALYEMGFEEKHSGTPLGSSVSLAIHESQSRLWENFIGRGRPFAKFLHGILEDYFPQEHKASTPQDIWSQLNYVCPSLIRTEADEVTYSLHIIIRLLLEDALISGDLDVSDLPAAWDEHYQSYLGIRPQDFRDGVMQDVHWYSGSMGYFPTYALGNLYAAMMMQPIRRDIPDLDEQIAQGHFTPLRSWLKKNVHEHGMRFCAVELVTRISGCPPSTTPFLTYVKEKFRLS